MLRFLGEVFKKEQVHQNHRIGINTILKRDGSHTNTQIFGIVVPYHLVINPTSRKDTIDNKKGNQHDQKSQKKVLS